MNHNMLVDYLPETVEIEGTEYAIETNFRTFILFEMMMQDPELSDAEKARQGLELVYPEIPENLDAAVDIHKNKPLLWLTRKLLLIMKEKDKGLFVGSVISKDLANYYMSYLYHYAESELTVTRRSRRNGLIKVRLLSHQAMYMDDVFLSGSNRKYLMMAFRKIQQCLERKLHLEFKESWRFYYVEYEDKYGVSHGCPADLAGYVYKRNCTVLRDHIFLKGRRAFKKVKTYLMKGYEVTQRMAQRAVSYYGWFKNSNLHQFMEKYGIEELQKYCKRRLSYLSKRNRAKEALAC